MQRLTLFSRLTYDEVVRLGAIARERRAAEGEVVLEENALGDALYVIRQGRVRVTRDSGGALETASVEELGVLGEGELFGEMSLVDDLLTSARVTATTPCTLLVLPRREFRALVDADPGFALKVYECFCRTLCDRLRRANAQLAGAGALATTIR